LVIDWYFDFISPYSYFQSERLDRLPADVQLRPRPILFAGLLDHWGQKGPAEIPGKRTFTYRHVQWISQREGIPFRFPASHPFNPIKALRLAVAMDSSMQAIHAIFRHVWAQGRGLESPEDWATLAAAVGLAPDEASARIASPEVKARLLANGQEAIAAGIFGVPTLLVDGIPFWGFDATAMATDYLRDPSSFMSEEMRRVSELPIGVRRPGSA
jgi:2-hydroxychromene-2-carboxylate isomerase